MNKKWEPWLLGVCYTVICLAAGATGFFFAKGNTGFGAGAHALVPMAFLGAMLSPFLAAIVVSEMTPAWRVAVLGAMAGCWLLACAICYFSI
jgi:hypothetical protein